MTDQLEEYQLLNKYGDVVGVADAFLNNAFKMAGEALIAARLMAKYPAALEAAKMRRRNPILEKINLGDFLRNQFYNGSLLNAAEQLLLNKVGDQMHERVIAAFLEENPQIYEIAKFRILHGVSDHRKVA